MHRKTEKDSSSSLYAFNLLFVTAILESATKTPYTNYKNNYFIFVTVIKKKNSKFSYRSNKVE